MLAGVSTEWYTKLEKGHIAGGLGGGPGSRRRCSAPGRDRRECAGQGPARAHVRQPHGQGGRANFARYHFLDPGSREFFVDWEGGAVATVALLRAEAGPAPYDMALRELIGELSMVSEQFSAYWGSHEILIRHEGRKGLQHPDVGELELTCQSTEIPSLSGPGTT
ncbi:MmyB family transcriptional regulator [Kocuria palustris]